MTPAVVGHRRAAVLRHVIVTLIRCLVVLCAVGQVSVVQQVLKVLKQFGPPWEDGQT